MGDIFDAIDYNLVDDLGTPITRDTFEKQNWIHCTDRIDDDDDIEYWVLPLPIDNPDEQSPYLVSSLESDSKLLELEKGAFVVEIFGLNGLGLCKTEEQIKILYFVLTATDLDEVLSDMKKSK